MFFTAIQEARGDEAVNGEGWKTRPIKWMQV